jgi:hypothetical protein
VPAEIVFFPGVTELPGQSKDPEPVKSPVQVFKSALRARIIDAIVVGTDLDGQIFIASQEEDHQKVAASLMTAVQWLTAPPSMEEDEDVE